MARKLIPVLVFGFCGQVLAQSGPPTATTAKPADVRVHLKVTVLDASNVPIAGYAVNGVVRPMSLSARPIDEIAGLEIDGVTGEALGTYVLDLRPVKHLIHTRPSVCGAKPIEVEVSAVASDLSIRFLSPSTGVDGATAPGLVKNVIDIFNTIVPNKLAVSAAVTPVSMSGSASISRNAALDTSRLKDMPGGIKAENADSACIQVTDLRTVQSPR